MRHCSRRAAMPPPISVSASDPIRRCRPMYRMRNPVRRYDWGSTEAIPELLGVTPDGRPQAELWMGAYETESSQVRIDRRWHDLAAVLRARGEPRLPFLAKVIAIGEPLSLQIHPATGPEAKV